MKAKQLCAGLALCLLANLALAQVRIANDPTRLGVGARPLGMGKVFTAFADDPSAIFLNPAGLSLVEKWELSSMSGKFANEMDYAQLSTVIPSRFGNFGVAYTGGGLSFTAPSPEVIVIGGEEKYFPSPSGTVSYQWNNAALLFSYGKQCQFPQWNISDLKLGTSLKLYSQNLAGSGINPLTASGFDLDIGALYQPTRQLTTALVLQNIVPTALGGGVKWSSGVQESLPALARLGLKYGLLGENGQISWRGQELALGLDYEFYPTHGSNPAATRLGLEWSPQEILAVRLGSESGDLTYGVGLSFDEFRFDYAYHAYYGLASAATNYFSLSYGVGKPKPPVVKTYLKIITPESGSILYGEKIDLRGLVTDRAVARIVIPGLAAPKRQFVTYQGAPEVNLMLGTNPISVKVYEKNGRLLKVIDRIAGTVEAGIPINEDNYFDAELSLKLGANSLSVEALDAAGNNLKTIGWRAVRLVSFSDVGAGYWAKLPIEALATLNIISGYPGGLFKPEGDITRAELCSLLVKAKPEILNTKSETNPKFKDLNSKHWAAKYIALAVNAGLAKGYPGNLFKPNGKISRAEGVTIIARFADLSIAGGKLIEAPYPDLPGRHWSVLDVMAAKEGGILNYLSGQNFEPNRNLTRAEVAEMLYRTKPVKQTLLNNDISLP
ncbi:MAG: S-layer homology domain-containing protein [Candidatus Margulisiibacteriota bacterium]